MSGGLKKRCKIDDINPAEGNSKLSKLDKEITLSIIDFLSFPDLVNLQNTCKAPGSVFSFGMLGSIQIFDKRQVFDMRTSLREGNNYPPRLAFKAPIPIATCVKLLSVCITTTWEDESKTGLKGRFFVMEEPSVSKSTDPGFDMKFCVSEGGTNATYFKHQDIHLMFEPRPKHLYYLWFEFQNVPQDHWDEGWAISLSETKLAFINIWTSYHSESESSEEESEDEVDEEESLDKE